MTTPEGVGFVAPGKKGVARRVCRHLCDRAIGREAGQATPKKVPSDLVPGRNGKSRAANLTLLDEIADQQTRFDRFGRNPRTVSAAPATASTGLPPLSRDWK